MHMRIGILIVGSLLWDENQNRQKWRRNRLAIDAKRSVPAPIRYGRRSQSRGCSYTMVFSSELVGDESRLGTAACVPCLHGVNSLEDLVVEAECLWAAERNKAATNGQIGANWGSVSLLVNPESGQSKAIREMWTERVSAEKHYKLPRPATGEQSIVDDQGLLSMTWPRVLDNTTEGLDAILATATDPTLSDGGYPSAEEIAKAWMTATGQKYVEYFHKNRESQIETFQDREIIKRLPQ